MWGGCLGVGQGVGRGCGGAGGREALTAAEQGLVRRRWCRRGTAHRTGDAHLVADKHVPIVLQDTVGAGGELRGQVDPQEAPRRHLVGTSHLPWHLRMGILTRLGGKTHASLECVRRLHPTAHADDTHTAAGDLASAFSSLSFAL